MRKTEENPKEYEFDKVITLIWCTIALGGISVLLMFVKLFLWLVM